MLEYHSFCICVYGFGEGEWYLIGGNITTTRSGFGSSVAMSDDGNYVAIGASSGRFTEVWRLLESFVRVARLENTIVGSRFGSSVAVTSNGSDLAVGAYGTNNDKGAVYEYTFNGTDYVQKGERIDGIGDFPLHGWSLDFLADATIVAIGGDYCCGYSSTIVVRWEGEVWYQRGQSLQGDTWSSVSLSTNGNILAVGQPDLSHNDTVSIYKFLESTPSN